jgi:hypothetical protein
MAKTPFGFAAYRRRNFSYARQIFAKGKHLAGPKATFNTCLFSRFKM